jgi:hypothetical protein
MKIPPPSVARHLGASWDVVKDIQKRYMERKFGRPKLTYMRAIAIGEIYMGKRYRSRTLLMDLETGAVVFVDEGKKAAALDPFWKRHGRTKAKIRSVAADMSPACVQAVQENLPKAVMVSDHFHLIKLFNEKLTQLRRDIYRVRQPIFSIERCSTELAGSWSRTGIISTTSAMRSTVFWKPCTSTSHWQLRILSEGGIGTPLETAGQGIGTQLSHKLDRQSPRLRSPNTPEISSDPCCSSGPILGLLRLFHLHRTFGGNQQQDQDHATQGLWISGS